MSHRGAGGAPTAHVAEGVDTGTDLKGVDAGWWIMCPMKTPPVPPFPFDIGHQSTYFNPALLSTSLPKNTGVGRSRDPTVSLR